MKKILLIITLGLFTLGLYSQSIKVSALPAATTISGADLHLIVQSGVTKKICDSLLLKNRTFLGTLTVPAITLNGTDLETALDDKLDPSDTTNIDSRLNVLETDTINIEDVIGDLAVELTDTMKYLDEDVIILNALGTPAIAQAYSASLWAASGGSTDMVDGQIHFQAVIVQREVDSIIGVKFMSAENGSFDQDNYNGVALYTYSAGVITQVAISANDSTIWETAVSTIITVPFTSAYKPVGGVQPGLYYVGFLFNAKGSPSTVPELYATAVSGLAALFSTNITDGGETTLVGKTPYTLADGTKHGIFRWFILY